MLPHFLKLHSEIHEENTAVFALVLGKTSFIATSPTKNSSCANALPAHLVQLASNLFLLKDHTQVFGIFSPWASWGSWARPARAQSSAVVLSKAWPLAVRSGWGVWGGQPTGRTCWSGGWSQGLKVQLDWSPHMWLPASHLTSHPSSVINPGESPRSVWVVWGNLPTLKKNFFF